MLLTNCWSTLRQGTCSIFSLLYWLCEAATGSSPLTFFKHYALDTLVKSDAKFGRTLIIIWLMPLSLLVPTIWRRYCLPVAYCGIQIDTWRMNLQYLYDAFLIFVMLSVWLPWPMFYPGFLKFIAMWALNYKGIEGGWQPFMPLYRSTERHRLHVWPWQMLLLKNIWSLTWGIWAPSVGSILTTE